MPGRDAEALTDDDLMREVPNTAGKPGKLGENVKCVVSVSMPTERVGLQHHDAHPRRDRERPDHRRDGGSHAPRLKSLRVQTVAFKLATHLQRHKVRDRVWLFPQLLSIVREWLGDPDGESPYVDSGDDPFPGLLLFAQKAHNVAEKIHKAIVSGSGGGKRLRAELPETDRVGRTSGVSCDTVKTTWKTDPTKCHLNPVPRDSGWETPFVEKIERMDEVKTYVKNQNPGFFIPYTCEGRPGNYYPDYVLKIDDRRGADDLLHLIVEITREKKCKKKAKMTTARTLWIPAVLRLGASNFSGADAAI